MPFDGFHWQHGTMSIRLVHPMNPVSGTTDPMFRALSACTNLQKVSIKTQCASVDAIRNLLQMSSGTILHLTIEPDHWVVVADEIRQGRCLEMFGGSNERAITSFKAIATAIRWDDNLEGLFLIMNMHQGFNDEASVALAEALTVNTNLRVVSLARTGALGAPAYEAFGAMYRVNTNLSLELPSYVNDIGDERRLDYYNQMRIEKSLNSAGRGTFLSVSHSTREEWVNALHELNASSADNSPAFYLSCLYSLLRLNPNVYLSQLVETTTPVVHKALAAKRMRRAWPWRTP